MVKISPAMVGIAWSMLLLIGLCAPLFMDFGIIYDPKAQIWLAVGFFLWLSLLGLIIRTPAMKFFLAGMGKKLILVNPRENKYLDFYGASIYGNLAHVKDKGFYIIESKDVFIEKDSKVPMAITYSVFGIPINPEMAEATSQLKELGVKNYTEMIDLANNLKADKKVLNLNILGKTVNLDSIVDYFGRDERSDFVEAEIQRRGAVDMIKKINQPENIFKWAVIGAILLIAGALAYTMISMESNSPAPSGGSTTPTMYIPGVPDVIGTTTTIQAQMT